VAEDQTHIGGTEGPGRQNVFAVLESIELRSGNRSGSDPPRQAKGEDEDREVGAIKNNGQSHDNDPRDARKNFNKAFHQNINPAAEVAGNRAPNQAEDEADDEGDEA